MATRPQIPGWNNVNLNKPEEYSSEFTIGGFRYANVTNVSTGQRQLYFVSGLGGTPLTQRALLTSTSSAGKIEKGNGYDDFVRRFGQDKLVAADKANKQQSIALLSKPGLSTTQESGSIKSSNEYKSTSVGDNSKKTQDETDKAKANLSTQQAGTRNSFSRSLVYPLNLKSENQDTIQFNMVKYRPRPLTSDSKTLNAVGERPPAGDIIGTVTLPVPNGISDSNSANWGSDDLNAAASMAANIANKFITQGGGAAATAAGENLEAAATGSGNEEAKVAFASKFIENATGTQNILSRTAGAVINTNMELLFLGPSLRTFNFTFKLASRSEAESQQILKIIRFFKQGMSPIRTDANLFLKAPHTFQLKYLHGKDPHKFLNRFKECALTACNVDYTPEGQYATFHDGAMVSYSINLQFQELEPIFNDDYGKLDGSTPDSAGIGY